MTKINVTTEIASKLKEFRISKNIKSKDVAAHINKTPAYYSKLEKATIKTIDKNSLEEILNFIANSNDGYSSFMEGIASKSSPKELNSNLWLMNFDTVERIIPIPKSLTEEINTLLHNVNISIQELTNYINTNEDLGNDFLSKHNLNANDIINNHWYEYETKINEKNIKGFFIFLKLNPEDLENILTFQLDTSNWLTIFSVIYHLLKLQQKQNNCKHLDNEKIKINTTNIMIKHKFYSLSDKTSLAQQANTEEEYNELLNEFDKENREYVNIILSAISFVSDYDVKYANKLLKRISKNIDMEPSFALRFMATDISKLNDLSVTAKKNYLLNLDTLTNESASKQATSIELFD